MLPSYMLPSYMLPSYMLPSYMLPSYMLPSYMLPSYMLPSYMLPSYMLPSYRVFTVYLFVCRFHTAARMCVGTMKAHVRLSVSLHNFKSNSRWKLIFSRVHIARRKREKLEHFFEQHIFQEDRQDR